jgi:phage/conjugal plasmid C-4 type zinc finger TraR family protein
VSEIGKFAMEQAEARVELERNVMVARVVARLPSGPGSDDCVRCGDDIPLARRRALPGTRTCVDCATLIETGRR